MGTPEASVSPSPEPGAARVCVPEGGARAQFDPALACALLEGMDLDAGLAYVLTGLRTGPAPVAHPAWPALRTLLGQIPVVRACRSLPDPGAGHPDLLDQLIGCSIDLDASPFGRAAQNWLVGHSHVARALRSRTSRFATEIERTAASHTGARVVALYAGHARELFSSAARHPGRVRGCLVEFDQGVIAAARARAAHGVVDVRRAALVDVLGGDLVEHAPALIYVPTLAARLPLGTLRDLVDALLPRLCAGGRLSVCVHTAVPEAGFLTHVVGWCPNVVDPERLVRSCATRRGIGARVERDETHGLAYVEFARLH